MSDQENEILWLESQFPIVSGEAFSVARANVLASGQSVLQSEHDGLYEVFPDGRKVFLKYIEPPTQVTPGAHYEIR